MSTNVQLSIFLFFSHVLLTNKVCLDFPFSDTSGHICLDTLQKKWSAGFSLCTVMMSVQALLSSLSSESGFNDGALKQIVYFPEEFKKTAAFWTYRYAMDSKKTDEMVSANESKEGTSI